ncbi:MAG: GatB/YqeY domain-containing protein [Armatimonadota bacterium]|nr:GatB/YqeY domain-containing protein [Armatimonadota bacterium]MDR7402461.1 GatB/YqeY domain-containing protein [Armatimonadota bacterium]MDR7403784.1 GatB/YqeY domain-containing protein [Armatimonadota bacterium]MDR7437852.1 GatB/YqeY domain-containing protein [Armatimonadota bacterium]MDR7472112.1 GatB/YqeY domain-containing protein [Armatimonadota bacterium]
MSLAERLTADLHQAMRAGDTLRVSTIRLARAAVRNAEIERGHTLSDDEVIEVLTREMKRRREAIEAYTRAGRDDLARKESLELAILAEYVPPPLSAEELQRIVAEAIERVGARDARDVGRVMAAVMPQVRGRADGAAVAELVRQALGQPR